MLKIISNNLKPELNLPKNPAGKSEQITSVFISKNENNETIGK